jgi:hypothetical protein
MAEIEPSQIFTDETSFAPCGLPQRFVFRPQPIHRVAGNQLVKLPAPGSGKFARGTLFN